MAGAGACPVSASPQRPTQPVGGIGDGPNDQGRKQVPDLVVARSALTVVSVGRVRLWPPPPGGRRRAWQGWPTDTRSARGVPGAGPARPGPCWSAGAPRWPSAARRPGAGEPAAPGEGAAAVESQLAGVLVAAGHEPVLACWPGGSRALVVQAQKRPAVQALALMSLPHEICCHARAGTCRTRASARWVEMLPQAAMCQRRRSDQSWLRSTRRRHRTRTDSLDPSASSPTSRSSPLTRAWRRRA